MNRVHVTSQDDLDRVLRDGNIAVISGDGKYVVTVNDVRADTSEGAHVEARDKAYVVARGSAHVVAQGKARVVASGNAHVVAYAEARVEAWGSAHVEACGNARVAARDHAYVEAWGSARVVAWGSARVEASENAHVVAQGKAHVVAWGNAHVVAYAEARVEAWGSAHVEAFNTARVVASRCVVVHQLSEKAEVSGGIVICVFPPRTAAEWCGYYGVLVTDGIATVYKAVSDDYRSERGLRYTPGSQPEAPDWDGGEAECGYGLHFAPSPELALDYYPEATRFLACRVALADMRAPRMEDLYLSKIKARRVCHPLVEVDRTGRPLSGDGG